MGQSAGPLMALQGGAGILGALGQYEAGQSNSAIHRMNAEYARTQATQSLQHGEEQAGVADLREQQLAGAQASSYAGQGVVAGSGSAGAVVASSAGVNDQDKAMLRLNARRQAYGFETQAESESFQGDMAKRLGNLGAASTLLGGAGQMAATHAMFSGGGSSASPTGDGLEAGAGASDYNAPSNQV